MRRKPGFAEDLRLRGMRGRGGTVPYKEPLPLRDYLGEPLSWWSNNYPRGRGGNRGRGKGRGRPKDPEEEGPRQEYFSPR